MIINFCWVVLFSLSHCDLYSCHHYLIAFVLVRDVSSAPQIN